MAFRPFNWTCPYCGRPQTVTERKFHESAQHIYIDNHSYESIGLTIEAVGCSNDECLAPTISVAIAKDQYSNASGKFSIVSSPLLFRRLLPESAAKPQPDYIPAALREDYLEACRIVELSPKAAATLARRCLQGMIRDFAGVSGRTLYEEVVTLRRLVEEDKGPRAVSIESVFAIDRVRSIGNIGAHMEKDIDHIVPVDADEAKLLIGLIESLFEEWYVERFNRQQRFAALDLVADEKAALRLLPPSS